MHMTPIWCLNRRDYQGRILFRPPRVVYVLIVAFLVFVVVLYVGMRIQQAEVDRAPSTIDLFTTSKVCGMIVLVNETKNSSVAVSKSHNNSQETGGFVSASTFDDVDSLWSHADELKSSGVEVDDAVVANCGTCGQCSNPHDVGIYDDTKNTLTGDAKRCAYRALIGGRGPSTDCMRKNVGFTDSCNECWVDNIMCDMKKCAFVCMWNEIFGRQFGHTSGGKEILNPCKTCDEKRCGRAFTNCAGANRRRSGIISDIARDDKNELCTVADDGWWLRDDLAMDWESGNWRMSRNSGSRGA
mmetsp:Transcript_37215/g.54493  ORF Transcript_37215/g.54493 Transcript_37215/m.54493 type:complete len:299 (-) Transcript_37215:1310-2206(-)